MEKTRKTGGKKVNPEKLVKALKKEFGEKISEIKIKESVHGKKNRKAVRVWATVKASDFKKTVKFLFSLQEFPHYSVSSGIDLGKEIEIINHFTLNYGKPKKLILFSLKTRLSKKKPEIDTITGLIPGAWVSEKEKQEFLGIKVKGIKAGRLFLDDSLPKDVYPWRRDSKGAKKHAINLHTGDTLPRLKS